MKNCMKRVLCVILIVMMALSLSGCSSERKEKSFPNEKMITNSQGGGYHVFTSKTVDDLANILEWLDEHDEYELFGVYPDGRKAYHFYVVYKNK